MFWSRLPPRWRIRRVIPKLPRPGRLPVDEACSGEHHIAARAGMCISDWLWRTNDRVGTCSWRSDAHSERVRHHVDGAPAGVSRLPWAACRPMALFWRLAPVVRFYRMFRCIPHRRTGSTVVAHAAPAPLVATIPLGDISVIKFTPGSLTIRGGSAVPGSAFH